MRIASILLLCAIGASVGCSAEDSNEETSSSSSDELSKGNVTRARPEVGQIEYLNKFLCTGTLVAPRVVLTAAHCVEFKTDATGGPAKGKFKIDDGKKMHDFAFDGFKSFAKDLGGDDMALLHLTTAVPAAIVKPASMASKRPPTGTPAEIYGYGHPKCTFSKDYGDFGTKRVFRFKSGTNPRALCGGDSGGPVFALGAVYGVNSGSYENGNDLHAYTYRQYAALTKQVRSWNPPVADAGPPDGGEAETDAGTPDAGPPEAESEPEATDAGAVTPNAATPDPAPQAADEGGCSMSSSNSAPSGGVLALVVALSIFRRKREPQRRQGAKS